MNWQSVILQSLKSKCSDWLISRMTRLGEVVQDQQAIFYVFKVKYYLHVLVWGLKEFLVIDYSYYPSVKVSWGVAVLCISTHESLVITVCLGKPQEGIMPPRLLEPITSSLVGKLIKVPLRVLRPITSSLIGKPSGYHQDFLDPSSLHW